MIKQTSLSHGGQPHLGFPKRNTTTNGVFSTNAQITITDVRFPKSDKHCIVSITADVFHSPACCYDLIIGQDVLKTMVVVKLDSSKGHVVEKFNRNLLKNFHISTS